MNSSDPTTPPGAPAPLPRNEAIGLCAIVRKVMPRSTTRDEVVKAWDALDRIEAELRRRASVPQAPTAMGELPYNAVCSSQPHGRGMEWREPLWDAINGLVEFQGPSKRQRLPKHASRVEDAVQLAMRIAIEEARRVSVPPATLVSALEEIASSLEVAAQQSDEADEHIAEAAQAIREALADAARAAPAPEACNG